MTIEHEPLHHFLAVTSFVLGLIVGSFLNVCVHRIPRGMSVISPRSTCPKSGKPIAWYDNLPIVSWLALGAKGRHSGQPIPWLYPMVEGLTGVLFVAAYLRWGLSPATGVYMLLTAGLIVATFVDLTDWTIPDEIVLPGIPIGIVCSLVGMIWPETGLRVESFNETVFDSLIGVAVGFLSLALLDRISLLLLGKHGMGMGDWKLLAMLGAFLGWKGVLCTVMLASFIGSFLGIGSILIQRLRGVEEPSHYLPFGPSLAAGGLMTLYWGPALYAYYFSLLTPEFDTNIDALFP